MLSVRLTRKKKSAVGSLGSRGVIRASHGPFDLKGPPKDDPMRKLRELLRESDEDGRGESSVLRREV